MNSATEAKDTKSLVADQQQQDRSVVASNPRSRLDSKAWVESPSTAEEKGTKQGSLLTALLEEKKREDSLVVSHSQSASEAKRHGRTVVYHVEYKGADLNPKNIKSKCVDPILRRLVFFNSQALNDFPEAKQDSIFSGLRQFLDPNSPYPQDDQHVIWTTKWDNFRHLFKELNIPCSPSDPEDKTGNMFKDLSRTIGNDHSLFRIGQTRFVTQNNQDLYATFSHEFKSCVEQQKIHPGLELFLNRNLGESGLGCLCSISHEATGLLALQQNEEIPMYIQSAHGIAVDRIAYNSIQVHMEFPITKGAGDSVADSKGLIDVVCTITIDVQGRQHFKITKLGMEVYEAKFFQLLKDYQGIDRNAQMLSQPQAPSYVFNTNESAHVKKASNIKKIAALLALPYGKSYNNQECKTVTTCFSAHSDNHRVACAIFEPTYKSVCWGLFNIREKSRFESLNGKSRRTVLTTLKGKSFNQIIVREGYYKNWDIDSIVQLAIDYNTEDVLDYALTTGWIRHYPGDDLTLEHAFRLYEKFPRKAKDIFKCSKAARKWDVDQLIKRANEKKCKAAAHLALEIGLDNGLTAKQASQLIGWVPERADEVFDEIKWQKGFHSLIDFASQGHCRKAAEYVLKILELRSNHHSRKSLSFTSQQAIALIKLMPEKVVQICRNIGQAEWGLGFQSLLDFAIQGQHQEMILYALHLLKDRKVVQSDQEILLLVKKIHWAFPLKSHRLKLCIYECLKERGNLWEQFLTSIPHPQVYRCFSDRFSQRPKRMSAQIIHGLPPVSSMRKQEQEEDLLEEITRPSQLIDLSTLCEKKDEEERLSSSTTEQQANIATANNGSQNKVRKKIKSNGRWVYPDATSALASLPEAQLGGEEASIDSSRDGCSWFVEDAVIHRDQSVVGLLAPEVFESTPVATQHLPTIEHDVDDKSPLSVPDACVSLNLRPSPSCAPTQPPSPERDEETNPSHCAKSKVLGIQQRSPDNLTCHQTRHVGLFGKKTKFSPIGYKTCTHSLAQRNQQVSHLSASTASYLSSS